MIFIRNKDYYFWHPPQLIMEGNAKFQFEVHEYKHMNFPHAAPEPLHLSAGDFDCAALL